jgi:ATP-dependent Zn protease
MDMNRLQELRDKNKERQVIMAYHEAGHAVAVYRYSHMDGDLLELGIYAGRYCPTRENYKNYYRHALAFIAISGFAAEEIFTGKTQADSHRDLELYFKMAGKKPSMEDGLREFFEIYTEAKEWLTTYRSALEALAAALLERKSITGRECKRIIRNTCKAEIGRADTCHTGN